MSLSLRSAEITRHESAIEIESKAFPGVVFRIARMSLARRIELTRRLRELGQKLEFLEAGQTHDERIESLILGQEIERAYLEWALADVRGLEIDGEPATPAVLVERGPEELCREVVDAIKSECRLTEEERKN
jgi:hypothetical protein